MSSDKSEEDEHQAISQQIVEYYKKYSQNKHLPKYFSGTSLSYMPPIVKEDEIAKSESVVIVDETNSHTLVEKESEPVILIEEPPETKVLSPTSSVTSNRKLEWDNGADIGYNNCNKNLKLHKSLSLPILLNPVDAKNDDKKSQCKLCTEVSVFSYGGDGSPDYNKNTSSSSSSYRAEVPVESSSSSIKTNPKPSSSSSSFGTLAYLKNKIGSPSAESTPKLPPGFPLYTETPIIPKMQKKKNRFINLCVTKPVLVQCLDAQKKKGSDKKIQTTFIENVSKSIQTSQSLEVLPQLPKSPVPPLVENQSVIFVNYDTESDKRTCSSNTQTDGDIIASQCDSFEYYKEVEQKSGLKRSSPRSDLVASDSSKDLPILGQLISSKPSKNVVEDLDRNIELLQKLLKSKKYDPATKERYIKKIVERIVDTKYSEDSTASSELFIPKKQKLEENIPWRPPQVSKFTVKTFSDEFLPTDEEKKSLLVNQSENNETSSKQNTSSSYQSWKDDKTQSERLLETQRGQGDHLVTYASKERQHQINWIKDEISHLTKLKGLLEKKVRRTTTVYMLSEHHDQNPQRKSSRNYVIETAISSTSTSSDPPAQYRFYEKGASNYQVVEGRSDHIDPKVKVVGDVEVFSDDKTTNLKVTARRINYNGPDLNPREPAFAGGRNYDTFPRSRAEERCFPCGMPKTSEKLLDNGKARDQVSVEIPLDTQPSLAEKLSAFVNTLTTVRPSFEHDCKCLDAIRKNEKYVEARPPGSIERQTDKSNSYFKNLKDVELRPPPCSIECQTDKSSCCCKEVQTSTLSRDECVDTQLGPSKDECVGPDYSKTDSDAIRSDKHSLSSKTGSDRSKTASFRSSGGRLKGNSDRFSSGRSRTISDSTESSTSERDSSTSDTLRSCICCKQKNVTSKRLYALRQKLSDQVFPLCRPCYRQSRRGVYSENYYNNPGHVCNCYTVVQTNTLYEIKRTINDLNELDQYCTCLQGDNRASSDCCKHCKMKLEKTLRNRNGIAYVLTFENTKEEKKKKQKRKPYLEEIKIKLSVPHKKKHKDKENNKKKGKHYDSEEPSSSKTHKRGYNLQEYLNHNRPEFVETAENRRHTMNQARMQREEVSDLNKLTFLKKYQEEYDKNAKRLFSCREMKEITKRNYKKLPEVQKKINDHRDKQLRQASRLMADAFNKKLRENVLRGKRNLPTDVKVVMY